MDISTYAGIIIMKREKNDCDISSIKLYYEYYFYIRRKSMKEEEKRIVTDIIFIRKCKDNITSHRDAQRSKI